MSLRFDTHFCAPGTSRLGGAFATLLLLAACTGDLTDPGENNIIGGPGNGGNDGTGGQGANGGVGGDNPIGGGPYGGGTVTPSGYLLLSDTRLAELQADAQSNQGNWPLLYANVENNFGQQSPWDSSPENYALAYLLTGDQRYADEAYAWVSQLMQEDVTSGSYLYFGDLMRPAAMLLNYCGDALSEGQRNEIASYMDSWAYELWFNNQGSGWGLADPGNNYHGAFLQGTAFVGYTLQQGGYPMSADYIGLVHEKLQMPGGVFDYLKERVQGGDWHEGANYGEREKERLFDALSVIVSMGGDNFFNSDQYYANTIYFALYQLQPDRLALFPSGDLARDVAMPASPYCRDHIQTTAFWSNDPVARGYAAWYMQEVTPGYDEPGFRGLIFKDILYGATGQAADLAQPLDINALPLSYRAAGTDFVNVRSGWDTGATSLTISGTPLIDQTHAHHDTGSFTLFKNAWLAADAASYSDSGIIWGADSHNVIQVDGHVQEWGNVGSLTHFEDAADYAYAELDVSGLYMDDNSSALLSAYTRRIAYLRPDHVVVLDRLASKGASYEWRLHMPTSPNQAGAQWNMSYGGGAMAVQTLRGGGASVAQDMDVYGQGYSTAYRIAVAPDGADPNTFLHVIGVASGSAPTLGAQMLEGAGLMGAAIGNQAVVFSSSMDGAPLTLPVSYDKPSSGSMTHTVSGVPGPVDVSVQGTTVTISAGSTYTPSAAGVIRFDG